MKSKDYWIEIMAKKSKEQSFALCTENEECGDLEKRKIYRACRTMRRQRKDT
jgi:hypothetical protein